MDTDSNAIASTGKRVTVKATLKNFTGDWSKNLGAGAGAGQGNFPAKFSFNTNTALCDDQPTPDYAVFSTGLAGSVTQASVVAYDNLYFFCTGATPLLYWAYDTGGQILTSPVLSLDGTQVAFMQTSGGVASLVILRWKKGVGTVGAPFPLIPVLASQYPTCLAPCMTEVPIHSGGGGALNDTSSSAFYDYASDVAWTGGAAGWLHKITGVFKGTPTEVNTGGFPVHVHTGVVLSSPVYDRITNSVFVSDSGGFLYRVDSAGGVTQSGQLDVSHRAIMAGPVVDSVAGKVYAFGTDDGSTNCLDPTQAVVGCTGVFQLSTTFSAGDKGTEAVIGSSNSTHFPNPLFVGSFDGAYYDSPAATPTGNLYVCGNTGGTATLYQVPIVNGVMSTTSNVLAPLAAVGSTKACSPVIDVPNPNTTIGVQLVPSERVFVSVRGNGLPGACSGGGCVISMVDAQWTPSTTFAVGQQVLSLNLHVETATTPGTGALLAANHPVWTNQIAATVPDGAGGQVVWIDQGSPTTAFVKWTAKSTYAPLVRILDTNGNVQALTAGAGTGKTGATQPTWNSAPGGTTTDNTVTWTNVGAIGTAALRATGGTSGMIIDDILGPNSTVGGSQIYFTTLGNQVCGTSGTGGCAVQASQTGLN
ncbi:MAG TPA: hypothetical protein VFE61_18235 [Candidatus Sulfotelmatobacter sp.]|nr:hypothetical protein [Candidatus Sulfotelmatobacter sp.]